MGIPADMDLLLGNGSDEIIQMLALAVNRPGAHSARARALLRHVPDDRSFVGLRYAGVPLLPDFALDLTAM